MTRMNMMNTDNAIKILLTDVTHCSRKPQKQGLIMDNAPFTE